MDAAIIGWICPASYRSASALSISTSGPLAATSFLRCGAPGRTRTADAGLRTASLCPLSYGGADFILPRRPTHASVSAP